MNFLIIAAYSIILGSLVGAHQLMPVTVFSFIKPWQATISFRGVMAFAWIVIVGGGLLVAVVGGLSKVVGKKFNWKKIEKIFGELGFGLALSSGVFVALELFLLSVEKYPVVESKKLLGVVLLGCMLLILLVGTVFYGAWNFYQQWIEKYFKWAVLGVGGVIALLAIGFLGKKVVGDRWPIKAQASDKPNVVWITVDALRHDRFSPEYMPKTYQWFEEEGYIFTKAMAPAPWTVPSFASMVTGDYPSQMRADLPMNQQEKDFEVLPEQITIAEEFKDLGYSTAAIVTNGWLNERRGFDQGFDYFVNLEARNVYDWGQVTNDAGLYKLAKAAGLEEKLRVWYQSWVRVRSTESPFEINGGVVIDEALKVKRRMQKPYFLWVHLIDPHGPYIPPTEFYPNTEGYTGDEIYKAEHMTNPQASEKLQELTITFYDQLVAYSDQELFRLLSALEKGNLLVVFNSDHGEQFWENDGMIGHGHNLYEENVHVPMAIKTDEEWRPEEELVDLKELKNIILSLIEREQVNLLGEDEKVFMEGRIEGPEQQAVIDNNQWKLISKGGRQELYNLPADPEERTNLQTARYYIRSQLSEEILEWQENMKQENKEYDRKLKQRHAGESLPDVAGY